MPRYSRGEWGESWANCDYFEEMQKDLDLGRCKPPRTKHSHPYNYDPYTIWGHAGPNAKCNGSDYTDRLQEWDYEKYDRLRKKHFHGHGVFNDQGCQGEVIEAFLREYHDDPTLKLTRVIAYCNQATGYPLWRLDYITKKGK